MQFVDIILADHHALIRSGLRFIHFLGLGLGLGTATLLDLIILRFFVSRTISKPVLDVFVFCSLVVTVGLALLWAPGLGFLAFYWAFVPESLLNPKVHAKIVIVMILTLNGMLIHRVILPFLRAQVDKQLLEDVSRGRKQLMITTAVISAVSWYCPLLIASLPQLNFALPAVEILAVYGVVLAAILVVAQIGLVATQPQSAARPEPHRQ